MTRSQIFICERLMPIVASGSLQVRYCPAKVPPRRGVDANLYGLPCGRKLKPGKEYCAEHNPQKRVAKVSAEDRLHALRMAVEVLRVAAKDAADNIDHAERCAWHDGPLNQPDDARCDCPRGHLRRALKRAADILEAKR